MKYRNCINIEVSNEHRNIEPACEMVKVFSLLLNPTQEELSEIYVAVNEAVNNCVQYAYPNGEGVITIQCRILKNNTLLIVVKDKGVGIENVKTAMDPSYTTGGDKNSGLGFTIIKSLMTNCKVTSVPNKGTTVNMKKRISG